MLAISHLRKEFSTLVAVDDVSFEVKPGEIFGLIGPNGAGKSTTIRMIMNILKPDAGEVLFNGKPANEHTKNHLGYLPEERGLYRKNKLLNVIAYFGSLKGLALDDAKKRGMKLLEDFDLGAYANRKVEELSKGNQQKVQFILSILHNPDVLVLDELFSGLDPINQELMKEMLAALKKENKAIIFSTHQMDHAEKLCDDLCLINKGNMVLAGSPSHIKERFGKNSIRIEFLGAELANEIPGVRRINSFGSTAELELEDGASTNDLLRALIEKVEVRRFERVEPSLHSIFLDVVGSDDAKEEILADAPAVQPRLISKDKRVRRALLSVVVMFVVLIFVIVQATQQQKPEWQFVLLFGVFGIVTVVKYFSTRNRVKKELLQAEKEGER